MSSDLQPRDGLGQYGPKRNSPPEVPLAEEVDGSFLFPPSEWPGGAEEYVRFWRTQPISDEALTNFTSGYAAQWDKWSEPYLDEYLEAWGNSEESRQLLNQGVRGEALFAAREEATQRYIDYLAEEWRPRRITTSVVRHVARAAQIVHNADRLPDDADRAAVGDVVMYTNQEGVAVTANMIWDKYDLGKIMPDAFYSRENALQKEIRELRDTITRG